MREMVIIWLWPNLGRQSNRNLANRKITPAPITYLGMLAASWKPSTLQGAIVAAVNKRGNLGDLHNLFM